MNRLAWIAVVACSSDPLEQLVDRACACDTPECSDAVARELDAWIDTHPHGRDRERDSARLDRFAACSRRFEAARRGWTKMTLEPLAANTPVTIGDLTIPSPPGFASRGNRLIADGPVEWVFSRSEPADSAEAWLATAWPAAIAGYRDVHAGSVEVVPAGPGWHVAARTAAVTDAYGHALFYMLIGASRDDTHRVYPSDVEAPAPIDPSVRASIDTAIAGLHVSTR